MTEILRPVHSVSGIAHVQSAVHAWATLGPQCHPDGHAPFAGCATLKPRAAIDAVPGTFVVAWSLLSSSGATINRRCGDGRCRGRRVGGVRTDSGAGAGDASTGRTSRFGGWDYG